MGRLNFILLITCMLGAGGCANLSFLPAEASETLSHPTHVEAYRTGKLDDHPGYGGKMDGFAVFDTGAASDELARELAAAVADPSIYHDKTRPNDFVPTVGYRFYRRIPGSGEALVSVDVLIEFDCDEVLLVAHDRKLKETFRRLMESDPGRARLLDLSRQAFPFDQLVQALTEARVDSTQPDP